MKCISKRFAQMNQSLTIFLTATAEKVELYKEVKYKFPLFTGRNTATEDCQLWVRMENSMLTLSGNLQSTPTKIFEPKYLFNSFKSPQVHDIVQCTVHPSSTPSKSQWDRSETNRPKKHTNDTENPNQFNCQLSLSPGSPLAASASPRGPSTAILSSCEMPWTILRWFP